LTFVVISEAHLFLLKNGYLKTPKFLKRRSSKLIDFQQIPLKKLDVEYFETVDLGFLKWVQG